ncbi:hypothetical protein EBT31_21130 [bacterium]|nr:hypothetical protein [bacterium]
MSKKETAPQEQTNPYFDLIGALAKMENVGANRLNPAFKARYVSLDALLDAVKPVLKEHNLALVQVLETEEGKVGVSTSLLHSSGHLFSFGKLMVKADGLTAQQVGGAITYIRRQSIQTACGISVDLDDDGHQASATKPQAPKVFMGELKYEKAAVEILITKGWLKPGQGLKDLSSEQAAVLTNHAFEQAVRNAAK